ncbi:MAG: acyl-CoA dehydrogenase C-terminal domain-containing protein [Myxococcota bacterium]|nr:acyl-CoA dehydrogenase C-terminal domain-containing protein [Myxococcota bacterium]
MLVYRAPIRDIRFILETLGYDDVTKIAAFEDFDLDTMMALIEQAGKFCTNEMLPANRIGDEQGVQFDPETKEVTTPAEFKALYNKFVESQMGGMSLTADYGGGGAPHAAAIALSEMSTATNKSFTMCPGLGHGLVEALTHYGSDEQKEQFLEKLITGVWTGTMCLTEPQCGTDLGLLTTKAVPEGDHYKLTGTKIWITWGEHDLAENIIHLVLARLPDAPDGIRGISAFIVPKINLDGSRNGIYCGGLEHKMGIHGSPTCVMNMEDATGYLVGEPHKGMRAMFVMMNFARLTVGVEGYALSEISYQTAVEYCKERRQGRSLNPERQEPNVKADCILKHPDVRRQLLNVRSTTEGMRALSLWVANLIDIGLQHEDAQIRQDADDLVGLLTPIVKSYCTERGFQNISDCMQAIGGSGYTVEWNIEQYLRDERIAMIYEGTNHIQALDLIGRKLPKDGGRLYKVFSKKVYRFIKENRDTASVGEFIPKLEAALNRLNEATMALGMKGMSDPEEAASQASNYLNLFGITTLAYLWARMALGASQRSGQFYETKVKTARYFYSHILPETDSIYAIINAGKDNMMAFAEDEF